MDDLLSYTTDNFYNDATLSLLLTINEISLIWGVTRRRVYYAVASRQLDARKSLDGTWLVTRVSAVRFYGVPKNDIVDKLYIDSVESGIELW